MRRRITLTILAVTVFGVGLFVLPTAWSLRQRYRVDDENELRRLAATAAHGLPALPRPLVGGEDDAHRYGLYSVQGQKMAGSGPDPGDAVVSAAARDVMAAGPSADGRAAAYAVGSGGVTTAIVRVSEPVDEARRRLRSGLIRLALGAALAAAAAALAGWLLTRRLTRPLGALQVSALALGDGDFTVDPPPTGMAELDDVGEALRSSARRIGTLVERERDFSGQASHQLRTPVAGLRVALETEMIHPRPDRHAILRESLAAIDRLEATVDGLLRLARGQPDDRQVLDVPAHLARLETRWRPTLHAAGRRLVTGMTGPLPAVRASATAIDHILDVLVDNAFQHGAGTISVQAAATADGVVVTVADEGPGVAEPAEIFKRRARPGGQGIGLALGRTLAAAEGADLRLRSARPSIFELTLVSRAEPPPT